MPKTSARLLALLSLLQARRDWPGQLLAERLEVSPRTVRRDVDRLRELGHPIAAFKGPDGGYRLDAGARLPPLLFDDDQAVALAVALRTATATGAGIGRRRPARSPRSGRSCPPGCAIVSTPWTSPRSNGREARPGPRPIRAFFSR